MSVKFTVDIILLPTVAEIVGPCSFLWNLALTFEALKIKKLMSHLQ